MATLGLEVLVIVLVVEVIVDLMGGKGTHTFAGLFALGGANLAMSSLLIMDFPFLCTLSVKLLKNGLLLQMD